MRSDAPFIICGRAEKSGVEVGDIVDLLKFYLSVPGGDPGALRLVRSRNEALLFVFNDLIEVNLLWSLLNLLPVFPLDGGQATGVILTWRDRRRGAFQLHVVSLVTAGAMVVFCLSRGNGLLFTALLFGMLGLQNFQMLQAMRHLRSPSFGEDADDWWRR